MTDMLWVALGGALGALGRFSLYQLVNSFFTKNFPAATLIVNVLGSYLFGLLFNFIRSNPTFGLFFAVGVLGSFTTFSTFSFETIQLLKEGKHQLFVLNIIANTGLALASFSAGHWLGMKLKS